MEAGTYVHAVIGTPKPMNAAVLIQLHAARTSTLFGSRIKALRLNRIEGKNCSIAARKNVLLKAVRKRSNNTELQLLKLG
jgi:hypothetical protein